MSFESPLQLLRSIRWREIPVTTVSVIVCVAIFAATQLGPLFGWGSEIAIEHALGRVSGKLLTIERGGRVEVVEQEYFGPFDLWDGGWWRIPASSFHHAGLIHLLCNLSAVVVFSPWLERRFGSLRLLLFIASSSVIALLPEFLIEHNAIGYSGVICAMFGALLALRPTDPELQEDLTDFTIQFGLGLLCLGVVATLLQIAAVANYAHFTGLAYGWIVGRVAVVSPDRRRLAVAGLLVAHTLVIPVWWLTCHPFWSGRYHWHLARKTTDPAQQELHLQRAIAWDSRLPGVWRDLTVMQWRRGEKLEAWRTVLLGRRFNTTNPELQELARTLWWTWAAAEPNGLGIQELTNVFGERAKDVREELKTPSRRQRMVPPGQTELSEMELDPPSLTRGVDLRLPELIPERGGKLPAVNPDAPDSAAYGRLL